MSSRESRAVARGSAQRRNESKDKPPQLSEATPLRILLLGKSASESSRVGNSILGHSALDIEAPPDVVERVGGRVKDRHVTLINSPHLLQTNISEHQITQTLRECVSLSDPGPHVIVLTVQYRDFTEEDMRRAKYVLNKFSEEALRRTIIITTDDETYRPSISSMLTNNTVQQLMKECGGGCLQLAKEINTQFSGILDGFKTILKENIEEFLTCELYNDADETLEDEDQSFLSLKTAEEEHSDGAVRAERQQKLNLVLCGNDERLKKSLSKPIRERKDEMFHDRLLNLVDLPALVQLSEQEVMRVTLRCVSLCHPGVHLFLLIIPDTPLNNEDRAEMEEIQRIFSSRINRHMMILIKQSSEHQTAELNEETQAVLQSFGGRHHFIGPNTHVSTLMEKIEEMLEENRGDVYSTETFLETQMEKLMKMQTRLLLQGSREELRIVLLGKTGVGKSATGNTILGRVAFTAETSQESVTKESQSESSDLNGRRVTVIDTPGLFYTELSDEEIRREISHCISMILPGPHVFIIVLNLGQRFTKQEEESVKIIQETFGEKSVMFTMVLFTRGDFMKNKTLEQCLGKPGSAIRKLTETCGNRVHVFNNNQTGDPTQVYELLEKIDNMVEENGGSFYSCKMFREMERERQERQMKILMDRVTEREEEMKILMNRDREREEKMKKHEEERKRMKRMMEEREKEKLEEKTRREEEEKKRRETEQKLKQESERREREKKDLQSQHEAEENKMKILMMEMKRERVEEMKKHEEEKERMKKMMQEERKNQDEKRNRREEELKKEIKDEKENQKKIQEEMRREQGEFRHEIEEMRREKEKLKTEKDYLKTCGCWIFFFLFVFIILVIAAFFKRAA